MPELEDNTLIARKGMNPVVNFNFMLRVEAVIDVPCKSISAFTMENEYEYIQEGGLNDYVHMRRKPISKPFTFKVERYVGTDFFDPLPNGIELTLPLLLMVSHRGNDFKPTAVSRCYTFTGCTVTGKEYGTLIADKSDLLVETTTIAYQQMLLVDVPLGRHHFQSVTDIKRGNTDIKNEQLLMREASLWVGSKGTVPSVKNSKVKHTYKIASRGRDATEPDMPNRKPEFNAGAVLKKEVPPERIANIWLGAGQELPPENPVFTYQSASRRKQSLSTSKALPPRLFDPKKKGV